MLRHAWALGVPMRWVTGDEVYGEAPALRNAVAESGRWYVVAVRANSTVWQQRPAVAVPPWCGSGRKPLKARIVAGASPPVPIPALVASWPAHQWQRLVVAEGEKGERVYDWACQRIVENQDHRPGRAAWLLVCRSPTAPDDVAFYLSNAPAETPLLTLAKVASTRYTVEQCREEAKGETGLDHYQVRFWQSWYRHITLSMIAHAWLAALRRRRNQQHGAWPLFGRTDRARSQTPARNCTALQQNWDPATLAETEEHDPCQWSPGARVISQKRHCPENQAPSTHAAAVEPGQWQPTPPMYQTPLQPGWGENRPFALAAGDACALAPPLPYAEEPTAPFYQKALEVYTTSQTLTDEQKRIARFWADTQGKTATPSGHSIAIVTQFLQQEQAALIVAAEAYAKVG